LANALDWGRLQTAIQPAGRQFVTIWICAFRNLEPERNLRALRLERAPENEAGYVALCGLTLFHGREHPLRYGPLALYRIALPAGAPRDEKRWQVEVDLGVVARTYFMEPFRPEPWLADPRAGLGEPIAPPTATAALYAEVTAGPDATLWLRDVETGK